MRPGLALHVTPACKLASIREGGLVPAIGSRSRGAGELQPRVYLFASSEDVDTALCNWLGDALEDEAALALLLVNIEGLPIEREPGGFELCCREAIGSSRIEVVCEDLDREPSTEAAVERHLLGQRQCLDQPACRA